MTSQLQYSNQVEVLFLFYSDNHKHSHFKFSEMMLLLSSNQIKLTTLLTWQPKKQYRPLNLVAETAIMAHVEAISKMWKCIPDGGLQSKTFVALKPQN